MQRSTTMELVGKTGRERYGYVEQAFLEPCMHVLTTTPFPHRYVEQAFDKSLLHLSSEVHHWEKLRFEVRRRVHADALLSAC